MYGYIYKITNLKNNKIYIGQHKGNRFDPNYKGSGMVIKLAFEKYGPENFKIEVIDWCKSFEELNEKEAYYINKYKSRDSKIGYNLREGGIQSKMDKRSCEKIHLNSLINPNYGMKGKKQSELCKQVNRKIHKGVSPVNKGKKMSEEQRQKCIQSHLGQIAWNKGIHMREETRQKLIQSLKGRKWMNNSKIQKIVPKNQVDDYLKKGWSLGKINFKEKENKLNG